MSSGLWTLLLHPGKFWPKAMKIEVRNLSAVVRNLESLGQGISAT